MKRGIILIAAVVILMCGLWETTAFGVTVTIPYEFVDDESIVAVSGYDPKIYSIEGQFVLNIDFDLGIASFDDVDATLSGEVRYVDYPKPGFLFTDDLNVLFNMTELESTSVTKTKIDFLFEKNIPQFPASDVHLTVMFIDNSIQMTGYFGAPVYDGPWYSLEAVVVPEPATILLLVFGGIMLKRRS